MRSRTGLLRAALVGAALLAMPATAGCKRERRTFGGPSESVVTATPQTSLYVGEEPRGGTPLDPEMPGYEETAFMVSEGKALYQRFNCIGCHASGGGNIGPALRDERWRYGSAPYDIALSIVAGRPQGMPSYRAKLVPSQLYQLVAYVRSLGDLVRSDAQPARDDHIQRAPSPTLRGLAIPHAGGEHSP